MTNFRRKRRVLKSRDTLQDFCNLMAKIMEGMDMELLSSVCENYKWIKYQERIRRVIKWLK